MTALDMSTNRNILECKGRYSTFYEKIAQVLIETYWNVKTHPGTRHLCSYAY